MPTALEALSGYEDRSGLTERVSGEKRGRRPAEGGRTRNGTIRPLSGMRNDERRNWIPDRTDPDVTGLPGADALPQAGRTRIRIRVGLNGLDGCPRVGSLDGLLAAYSRRDDVERLHEDRDQHVRQTGRNEDPAPALGARKVSHAQYEVNEPVQILAKPAEPRNAPSLLSESRRPDWQIVRRMSDQPRHDHEERDQHDPDHNTDLDRPVSSECDSLKATLRSAIGPRSAG